MRYKVALRFAVTGDRRFLSHRDLARLFERAISRANLPIRYSSGFNPRPRLWLPLPRGVGVASDDELLVLELDRHEPPCRVLERLADQMPEGIVLREAFEQASRVTPRPVEVTYHLELSGKMEDPGLTEAPRRGAEEPMALAERIRTVMAAGGIDVERTVHKGGRTRIVNLRPWIIRLEVNDTTLIIVLHVSPEGSARPAEVLGLLGLDPIETLPRLCRASVGWEGLGPDGASPTDSIQPAGSGKG
ncbi:MAG: DUF2344 domain-containing protein [Phycisphaerae bacterium]|nr:DUF2344 domain-containing protein [Phycisphaerae bacterium]